MTEIDECCLKYYTPRRSIDRVLVCSVKGSLYVKNLVEFVVMEVMMVRITVR
jgi:hypothetical protein